MKTKEKDLVKAVDEHIAFHKKLEERINELEKQIEILNKQTIQQVKNLKKPTIKQRCFCGDEWDGVECESCGFDATEVDIY